MRTYRAGAAAKAGHDLLIEVTRWAAELSVRGPDGASEPTGTVQQSQHGVRPYSAFFRALKLRDGVGIQVDVELPDP